MIKPEIYLLFLIMLLLKHLLCDWLMQSDYEIRNKGTYLHPGGINHAFKHMVGTMAVTHYFAPEFTFFFGFLDGLIHYHIDWGKQNLTKFFKLTPENKGFWFLIGLDQFLHQLTYILLIYLAFNN